MSTRMLTAEDQARAMRDRKLLELNEQWEKLALLLSWEDDDNARREIAARMNKIQDQMDYA